jgi:aspartyl-tRNA(Asn)/glutamyl-tRNA(Gln) amidotransferase subunit B
MEYEVVIGLEVHAELLTRSKMFCACPVVDTIQAEPNSAVCPVCSGMPGVLPVINRQAVENAIRVALALECKIAETSIFARKNYFYPDLPKGYQITQYEYPLAQNGRLQIQTSQGEHLVRIRRVHLEEDTGKLTHTNTQTESYSLEKGVIRFEANVSVRQRGSTGLGTRVEIKNLNSFQAMERGIAYQVQQQIATLERGGMVKQETAGWDDVNEVTFVQRSKEEAEDYRYFPEPDLPPLVVDKGWIVEAAASLPELPRAKALRFTVKYGLNDYPAALLVEDQGVAAYFEAAAHAAGGIPPATVANWVTGELFAWMNQSGQGIEQVKVTPAALVELLAALADNTLNQNTAKVVLAMMLTSGKSAGEITTERSLQQISDVSILTEMVQQVLAENPDEVQNYLNGKETLANWFFGQVMRAAKGQANPQVLRSELDKQLVNLKAAHPGGE